MTDNMTKRVASLEFVNTLSDWQTLEIKTLEHKMWEQEEMKLLLRFRDACEVEAGTLYFSESTRDALWKTIRTTIPVESFTTARVHLNFIWETYSHYAALMTMAYNDELRLFQTMQKDIVLRMPKCNPSSYTPLLVRAAPPHRVCKIP